MIPRVSKAFFIPADPPSPFLSLFVITNSGKSQKSQSRRAVAPVVGRGGVWSRVTVQGEQGEGRGALLLVWGWGRWWVWSSCGAVLMVLGLAPGGTWHLALVLGQAGPSPAPGPGFMGRADPTALARIWPRSSPSMEHLPPHGLSSPAGATSSQGAAESPARPWGFPGTAHPCQDPEREEQPSLGFSGDNRGW